MAFGLLKSSVTKSKLFWMKLKHPTANNMTDYKKVSEYTQYNKELGEDCLLP